MKSKSGKGGISCEFDTWCNTKEVIIMTQGRRTKWSYLLAGLLAGAVFSGFMLATCSHGSKTPIPTVAPDVKTADAAGQHPGDRQAQRRMQAGNVCRDSFADVAEKVVPSVVNVHPTRVVKGAGGLSPFSMDPFFRRFFEHGVPRDRVPERRMQGLGSGVIVSQDGYIVTNYHVVAKAADIRVSLHDKRELKAEVVGKDPRTDLALLKVDADDLKPAKLGRSGSLRVGDVVLAVGNPFGVGETVTMGIVSAVGRTGMGITDYEDFIQTDAAINPGNSGGALVNINGEVVGIPTAIVSRTGGYQGVGFAIPSDMVGPIVESLRKDGKVSRSYLGVMIQKINPSMADALGLKAGHGVLVSEVQAGTPAEKAGLKSGDVILELDGKPVRSFHHFRNRISVLGAGTTVRLRVKREDKTFNVSVKLEELPDEVADVGKKPQLRDDAPGGSFEGPENTPLEGVKVGGLTPTLRKRLNVPRNINGVVVESVSSKSPAVFAGLQSGDIIMAVNRKPTPSLKEFRSVAERERNRVFVHVWRRGSTLYLGWTTR